MKPFILIVLVLNTSVFCAMVGEFPTLFNETSIDENDTTLENITAMTTAVSEVIEELIRLEEETNETNDVSIDNNLTWNAEASPLLSALRNLWTQASIGLLDPLSDSNPNKQIFRAIEHGLIEATTILANQLEETTFSPITQERIIEIKSIENIESDNRSMDEKAVETKTVEEKSIEIKTEEEEPIESKEIEDPIKTNPIKEESDESKQIEKGSIESKPFKELVIKRQGDLVTESNTVQVSKILNNKRQATFDFVANMSTSCSNCYEELNECVQKCFASHNCNDIQRGVRACPPVTNTFCNPFLQWSQVDDCQTHSDCKSPLLCCSDGCANRCLPGVWRL